MFNFNNHHKKERIIKEELSDLAIYAKPHFWENIPILGTLHYAIRMQRKDYQIRNNLLHKAIMHYRFRFILYTLVIGFIILFLLTPWMIYYFHMIAIKKITNKLIV